MRPTMGLWVAFTRSPHIKKIIVIIATHKITFRKISLPGLVDVVAIVVVVHFGVEFFVVVVVAAAVQWQ